jgi:N4-gp56 family major capsid protein
MVFERFAQARPMPMGKTKTVKFRRYETLPRATAPLAEGVPPAGRQLTFTDYTATLEQYGDVIWLTDAIKLFHEDAVFQDTVDNCGYQAAETLEVIRFNVAKSGTNVFYADEAGSRGNVDSPPLRSDFRRIYRSFRNNKARQITRMISPSQLVSTEPVDAAYFCLGHTDLDADFRNIEGFIPSKEYAQTGKKKHDAEIGAIDQFRIVLTALMEPWEQVGKSGTTYLSGGVGVSVAAACDVYPVIILGEDAFATVPLKGENSVEVAMVNPGKKTTDQPLGQKGFVSWVTWQTAIILNHLWMARLECAATASPTF